MKISELERLTAIGYTESGKTDVAKQMIKHFMDKMTPEEKAYAVAYQWVMTFESEEEYKAILKALYENENIITKEEVEAFGKQYRNKYNSNITAIGLACYQVHGFCCLAVLYNTDSNDEVKITYNNIDRQYGVLCYVNNLNEPVYSELGSVFFKWVGDGYVKHN